LTSSHNREHRRRCNVWPARAGANTVIDEKWRANGADGIYERALEGIPIRFQHFSPATGKAVSSSFLVLRNKKTQRTPCKTAWYRIRESSVFRGQIAFSTWMTRIVLNAALMNLRKQRAILGIS